MEIGDSLVGVFSILSLPQDVFAVMSRFLSPSDVCNLTLCSKSLCNLVDSEKTWLVQCEAVKVIPLLEVIQWRIGISSYKKLCKFLVKVIKPLVGIWVQQDPDDGNVVYVMTGFLSVVGCRIIPQDITSLRTHKGKVLWSPAFEIICDFDGSVKFFLHGRDTEGSCLYPGFVMGIEKSCNVLLLEVEPFEKEASGFTRGRFPFWQLPFSDKRSLLDIVASRVGIPVLEPLIGKLFPTSKDDEASMLKRRTMLLKMHKCGCNMKHMKLKKDELLCENINIFMDKVEVTPNKSFDMLIQTQVRPKKSFKRFIGNGINHILGISSSSTSLSCEISRRFLRSGNTFGLSLSASYTKVDTYQEWLNMNPRFSFYKLPVKNHVDNQDYNGLWGGTFGWPPKNFIEDEPSEFRILLMLSYDESQDEKLLVATKILEGPYPVDYPNGCKMFEVNIETPSLESFPFDADGREFENSYTGEGIARGKYGYWRPNSKLGSLFVFSNGLLAFIWQESKDVLTLQRLNLEEILKNGLGYGVLPFDSR